MGDFDDAIRQDPDLLRTILILTRELYELYGRWPTADEIRVQLGLPREPR